jgi:riboflavin synthase
MFTGIIEEVGKVAPGESGKLTVYAKLVLEGMELGASIAVNGVCLTVTEMSAEKFSAAVMPETLRRTNLGRLSSGNRVNLERPLTINRQIGGHLVQGHVDDTGKVMSLTRESGAALIKIGSPPAVMRYIVEKGFVAVNGISLTVVHRESNAFVVSVVEFTRNNTILSDVRIGDIVNLEVDIIAKYVEQLVKPGSNGVTADFLRGHGFSI